MPRGLLITFEGSEGCGKSTQVERLAARLRETGESVAVTREPGGTAIGEHIRHLLQFAPESAHMTAESELLLFEASRAQLVREVIQPARTAGTIVICDRFFDSTTVYQGAARKLPIDVVEQLNRFALADAIPDLTFVIDLDPATARTRMLRRVRPATAPDRMEQEAHEFYERVAEAYRALAARETERVVLIDGSPPPDQIEAEIWRVISDRFPQAAIGNPNS
ncbi:MAG: dTMP kinase [Chthoniobacterales bacterium]